MPRCSQPERKRICDKGSSGRISELGQNRKNSTRAHVFRFTPERWGNRPAPGCGYLKILGAALQADGETRSVVTASSIRRRSAAWTILLDWTYRSRRPASALWMTQAESCGK